MSYMHSAHVEDWCFAIHEHDADETSCFDALSQAIEELLARKWLYARGKLMEAKESMTCLASRFGCTDDLQSKLA